MYEEFKITTTEKFDTNLICICKSIDQAGAGRMKLWPRRAAEKKLIEKNGKKMWNEVLHENYPKLKLFIDVEYKFDINQKDKYDQLISNQLLEKINGVAKKLNCKVHISNKSRQSIDRKTGQAEQLWKISYHAIYDVYFQSIHHIKQWLINEKIIEKESTYVMHKKTTQPESSFVMHKKVIECPKIWGDYTVYKEHNKFSLPNTYKGKCDKKPWKIITNSKVSDFFITDQSKNYNMIDVKLSEELQKKKNYKSQSEHKLKLSRSDLKKYEKFFIGYNVTGSKGNILVLQRKDKNIICPVCKKVHSISHDQFYGVIENNGEIYFKCHANRKIKYKVGEIKMCEYLTKIDYDSEYIHTDDLAKYYKPKYFKTDDKFRYTYYDKKYMEFIKPKISKSDDDIYKMKMKCNKKCIILHSGTGTGKSQWAYMQIRNYKKVLDITSRISLSKEHMKNMKDFTDYNKQKGELNNDKLIICLNSIDRIKPGKIYDCIILDEINSIINHLCSSTIDNISYIYSRLFMLIQNAKKVLCMDADITDMTIKFLNSIFNKSEILYIRNTYVRPRKEECHYYIGPDNSEKNIFTSAELNEINKLSSNNDIKGELETLYKRIIGKNNYSEMQFFIKLGECFNNGDKMFIGCDRKRSALLIESYLRNIEVKMNYEKEDIRCYTSDGGDLNDILTNNIPKIFICSPRVSYGISLNEPDQFDSVWGYYKNTSINVQEQLQQISRYRRDCRTYIYSECNRKVPKFWDFQGAMTYYNDLFKISPKLAEEFTIKIGYNKDIEKFKDYDKFELLKSHKIIKPQISINDKDLFNQLKIYTHLYNEKSAQCPSYLLMQNLIDYKGFNIILHKNNEIESEFNEKLKSLNISEDEIKKSLLCQEIKKSSEKYNDEFIKKIFCYESFLSKSIETIEQKYKNEVGKNKFETLQAKMKAFYKKYAKIINMKNPKYDEIFDGKINNDEQLSEELEKQNKIFHDKYGRFLEYLGLNYDDITIDELIYLLSIIKQKKEICLYLFYLNDFVENKNRQQEKLLKKNIFNDSFSSDINMIESYEFCYELYLKICGKIGLTPITHKPCEKKQCEDINTKLISEVFGIRSIKIDGIESDIDKYERNRKGLFTNIDDVYNYVCEMFRHNIYKKLHFESVNKTSKWDKSTKKRVSVYVKSDNMKNINAFYNLFLDK